MSVSLRPPRFLVALSVCTVLSAAATLAGCDKKKDRQTVRDKDADEEEEERYRARRAKSPERMCEKLANLESNKRKQQNRPPADQEKEMQNCVKDLTTMQNERPDQYECMVPCTNKSEDEKVLMECFMGCLLKEPTGPSREPSARPTAKPSTTGQPERSSDPFGLD